MIFHLINIGNQYLWSPEPLSTLKGATGRWPQPPSLSACSRQRTDTRQDYPALGPQSLPRCPSLALGQHYDNDAYLQLRTGTAQYTFCWCVQCTLHSQLQLNWRSSISFSANNDLNTTRRSIAQGTCRAAGTINCFTSGLQGELWMVS